jgi:fructosamine-3-kinase
MAHPIEHWEEIGRRIAAATGTTPRIRDHETVGGGSINHAYMLHGASGERWFVKLNDANGAAMFAAEAAGLEEICRSQSLRVPTPVCHGIAGDVAFLVLEYLELRSASATSAEQLGRGLAAMHRYARKEYGWDIDNAIGSTPQPNSPLKNWTQFWHERRLGFQLALANRNDHGRRLQTQGKRLLDALPKLLAGHAPPASLLHGDLWSGNYGSLPSGAPVIFDPAVYYGDRETDLAMTELFGGFPPAFYRAYREAWPLAPGYELRRQLYNLYHVLNHLNLFGGGYLSQAEGMIGRLLGEAG